MEIVKLLTRGIQGGLKSAPTNLPSAGNRPNPQFFHDDVGSRRGTKRKRAGGAQGPPQAEEDLDVDFFAAKQVPAAEEVELANKATPAPVSSEPEVDFLDHVECRDLLRSHRLKFTLLSGFTEARVDSRKPKKNTAKKESVKRVESRDEKNPHMYPQPLRSFHGLDYYAVPPELRANIAEQGFREPTEVQLGSLPLLLRPGTALQDASETTFIDTRYGIDFLAVAPTGSGKTITFLIPAITAVMKKRKAAKERSNHHGISVIVVAPTRELVSQIVSEGRKLAAGTGVRIFPMKKGVRILMEGVEVDAEITDVDSEDACSDGNDESEANDDLTQLDDGLSKAARGPEPDILVTTPKALLNILSRSKSGAKRTLPSVVSLVLDEADVLLDPLFQKQTMGIWKACSNPELQLTFWSATMASNVESLITTMTTKRSNDRPRPLIRLVVGLKDTAVPNITHKLVYTATEAGKLLALRQLLHPSTSSTSGPPLRPPFLVFTQTVERAQALHDELAYDIPLEAGGSARRIAVLHSTLRGGSRARSKAVARFRAGEVWILITTDVLARGIDFRGVNGVVSYDVPGSAAAYVHRAGRTGRAGREGGVAVTFYTKEDIPFVRGVANVIAASERQAGRKEGEGVQQWLLDALPKVAKADRRRLKVRGVETRRAGGKAKISTKSAWEKRRENNRKGAIEGSKRRKRLGQENGRDGKDARQNEDEWGGLDD